MSRNAERTGPRRDERGAILVITALSLVMLLTFGALAIDIGMGASRTRDLHQVADIIAVDVARILDGTNPPAGIDAQVAASSARNDFAVSGTFPTYTSGNRRVELTLGCWVDPDPANPNDLLSFQPCARPDAVRVRAFDTVDYVLADVVGIRNQRFDRTATAALLPNVDIGIGSVGVALQQQLDPVTGSVYASAYVQALNARLKAAFDTSVSLTPPPNGAGLDILSYRGLAASDVTWDDLATNAGFASPSQLADATITKGALFEATARSLESQGNNTAAASIRSFASRSTFDQTGTVRLGDAFQMGTGTAEDPGAARSRINVMDLLIGSASVINNRNFAQFTFTPAIPNVLSVTVQNATVEPVRWRYFARLGDSVNTSQIRQQIYVQVDGGALGILGLSAPITIPIVVEGATGDATLSRLRCQDPRSTSPAVLDAVTSLTRARIGVATNLTTAGSGALTVTAGTMLRAADYTVATLISLGISGAWALGQDITGNGTVSLGGGSSTHTFYPEATPNPPQRAQGGLAVNIGAALRSNTTTGLPLIGTTNLMNALSTVFNNLGAGIIDPALHAAGVTLGGADLFARKLECDQPQLVE